MSETATIESVPAARLLSVPEAAEMLRVNVKTLRKAIALGQVKTVTLGSAVRVSSAEVERLLAAAGV